MIAIRSKSLEHLYLFSDEFKIRENTIRICINCYHRIINNQFHCSHNILLNNEFYPNIPDAIIYLFITKYKIKFLPSHFKLSTEYISKYENSDEYSLLLNL